MELLPRTEAEARLRRLQLWMAESSVDAVFILQNADLYYFAGTVQNGLLCLPASGEPLYLVQKSAARARMESPWLQVVPMAGWKKARSLLESAGCQSLRRVGLELDVLPTANYLRLQGLFDGIDFVDASEIIRRMRMVKSSYEVDLLRNAASLLREAFAQIPAWARPGATELEIAANLEGFLRRQGHQGITRTRGFNFELGYGAVSAGPSASHPTCFPGPLGFEGLYAAAPSGSGRRPLVAGQTLVVDLVAGYGGYFADKTRTFALGAVPGELTRGHAFAMELLADVEGALRPGVLCSHIYQRALERVSDSPYADAFMGAGDSHVRFIGHGLGLEVDEWPVLAAGFDWPLEAGMTIAVEPKIFFPEGGVGLENTYAITDSGFEKLTVFPEEMIRIPT